MMGNPKGARARVLLVLAAWALGIAGPAAAAPQDDAGSGSDAGDTFEDATLLSPRGPYAGALDRDAGDAHDWYRFHLDEGAFVSVLIEAGGARTEPMTLVDPLGAVVDAGTTSSGFGASAGTVFTAETRGVRLAVHRAPVAGDYRLHVQAEVLALGAYTMCFMNCEGVVDAPNDLIFGGSLPTTRTRVLLVPPSHGDMGDPFGPTVLDYIEATRRGIHRWTAAMDEFARDYPRFAYLRDISVEIEIFDGARPVDPAGYEVIVGYVAAGPVFRGVASDTDSDVQSILDSLGLGEDVHYSGRVIALSLFGSAPRAGQVMFDFPEINDLEIVTIHEFGHTFGLGHTRTWHPVLGPDLMNSPAPFVYGNGFPAGDGGERTAMKCLSSLNLYGMVELYDWIPSGVWTPDGGSVGLPPDIPYTWYCGAP